MNFIDPQTMRRLNRRFTTRTGLTDVLSFRYAPACPANRRGAGRQVVGEILVSPACARRYAKQHGLSYRQELARYVIHGLLHWMGHEDRTARQRQKMRAMEDRLLIRCQARTNDQ